MTALIHWVTGNPARAFLAAGLASLVSLFALPMAAWLPAGVVVLALLAGGAVPATAAALGAAAGLLWVFLPAFGAGPALIIALAVLLPSYLAASALAATRSLSLVFQAATIGAGLLVLAIHGLLGDPQGVLMPLVGALEPMLQRAAETLSQFGIERSPQEIGAVTVHFAWRTLAWIVLLHAMLAQFAGLWAFGKLREPGLFGREFRQLKLGRVVAWIAVAAFATSLGAQLAFGQSWQAADDLVFVLAAAYLMQALAVVHGLRELQVIGLLPLILAYIAAVLLPMALVGIGFADTWVRFRERFAGRPGGAAP
ncbi:MAG: hypothetical protein HW392_1313 [Steroidobacteraceae bacterium]|nr:hypothetical protein [Steroidobacteraceae bacterium]